MGRIKQNKTRRIRTARPVETLHAVAPGGGRWEALGVLFAEYCQEKMQADEFPWGVPVDFHRVPFLVADGEEYVGFISVDRGRKAVELVYVRPGSRRQGHASRMMNEVRRQMGAGVTAKGPFSPSGLALIRKLDMGVEPQDPVEMESKNREAQELQEGLAKAKNSACKPHGTEHCDACILIRAVKYATGVLSHGRPGYEIVFRAAEA